MCHGKLAHCLFDDAEAIKVIADLEGCEAYIDDVVIYKDTWEEHVRSIR